MKIFLHNSLSNKTEPFKPLEGRTVRIYSCGPTVYNYAHIGNMRAFLFADLLQRTLRTVGGYNVKWVMNITNIDDKTIRDSGSGSRRWLPEMGEQTDSPIDNLMKFTEFYLKEFLEDIGKLGIKSEHFYAMPKATDYIPQMQALIRMIHKNGFAYESGGSVYFNVSEWRKFDLYGKLKKIDFDNSRVGNRIDSDQYEREEASDFVLWKARKPGEPFWDFSFDGRNLPGRPGWHIECSAMEQSLFGLPFEIHTGGIDLKFPHHEDEIAQSKAGYGIDPTVYWCHNEFLEVEGQKMSKSLGNFFTLRDLINIGIDPLDIRYAMLSAHYGSKYNFKFSGITAARKARFRIQDYIFNLFETTDGNSSLEVRKIRGVIFNELANDLHTPKALAHIFNLVNNNPAEMLNTDTKEKLLAFFTELNSIFDVWEISNRKEIKIIIPDDIQRLAKKRFEAKNNKNFAEADRLRQQIMSAGFTIKDTKDGYEILPN